MSDPAPPLERILLVKTSSLGDVVHALPAAVALRRLDPTPRITWVVEDWAADVVDGHPAVDRVVRWPRMRTPRSAPELCGWIRALRAAARDLRSERYDVALDLQGLAKSAAIVLLSGAPRRLGIEGQREGAWLVARAVPVRAPGRHAVEENLLAAAHLGAPPAPPRFELAVDPRARAAVEDRLRAERLPAGRPLLVVSPSASTPRKSPPVALWRSVVAELCAAGSVILTGTSERRRAHAEIAAGAVCRDWTGTTSLRELVALLDRASLVLAPDCGAAHVAAALGRPVVSLYGPTPPARLAPYGQEDRVIRRPGLCTPACGVACASGARCLAAIDPREVRAAALRALG
jgi:lipopolysaccharide heptosyltransferase I